VLARGSLFADFYSPIGLRDSSIQQTPAASTFICHPRSQNVLMENKVSQKRRLPAGKSFIEFRPDILQQEPEGPSEKKIRRSMDYAAPNTSSPTAAWKPSRKIECIVSSIMPRVVSCEGGDLSKVKPNRSASSRTTRSVPQHRLMTLLKTHLSNVVTRPSLNLNGFFLEYTEEMFDSYGRDVITAIRKQDLDELRRIHASEGRTLQCANRFGESILHMACRRGFTDVVRFLIKEAGVSPRVRDDMGRTPMHDACWTCEPNPELAKLLIKECPELLVLKDRRGSAPFEYTRVEHTGAWSAFLLDNREIFSQKDVIDRIQAVQFC